VRHGPPTVSVRPLVPVRLTSWGHVVGGGQARRQDIAHGETDAELHVRDFDLSFDRASSHNVWLISGSRNWQRVERELKVFVLQ